MPVKRLKVDNPPETVSHKLTIALEIPKGEEIDQTLIDTITNNAQMDLDMWFVRKRMARHQAEVAKQLANGLKSP